MSRELLPNRRRSELRAITYQGRPFVLGVSHYADGRPGEVFVDGKKEGSDEQQTLDDACVIISLALQHGVSRERIANSLGKVPAFENGREVEAPASVLGLIVDCLDSRSLDDGA